MIHHDGKHLYFFPRPGQGMAPFSHEVRALIEANRVWLLSRVHRLPADYVPAESSGTGEGTT